ncbi:MAG: hypothetical protein ACRENH_00205, partial [Gemmatimonadaceae bacterium]
MQTADERIDRLYRLLPAIHRIRDHERGHPLHALLQVIAEQVNVIEDDIHRLYENWFIETCEDWVVPYIGDLIGYEPVSEAGRPGGRALNRTLIPRRELANTIRYRRRKGTLALLELLARDVAGWPARAVEFHKLLGRSDNLEPSIVSQLQTVDVRSSRELPREESAFDALWHTPDVRRINSQRAQGRFGAANVGLFVWRLGSYSITRAPARCIEDVGQNYYTFSVLGNNAPLFNRPREEADSHAIAGPLNVPEPINRDAFSEEVTEEGKHLTRASRDYYGLVPGSQVAQSVAIWAENLPAEIVDEDGLIRRERIIPADLTKWSYVPKKGYVAVDPVLGRIAFPIRQLPKRGVWVSYHYGFSADIGGGEYARPILQKEGAKLIRVAGKEALQKELELWRRQINDAGDVVAHPDQPDHAVIEIVDSGVYVLPVNIYLGAGHTLQIRAAVRTRPVLRLLDWQTDLPDNLSVIGEEGSRFTLDGLMVAGRGVQVEGKLSSFTVRHSTLVPGWSLDANCDPERPSEPSIELIDSTACVVIEHSIVGSIQINNHEVTDEPIPIRISDSIVDATGVDCDSPECEAIGAAGSLAAHAELRVWRSTVIGRVMVHAIELAENSIFVSPVSVARRQIGCMRFCYVRPHSRTPRRYQCQPDLVEQAAYERLTVLGASEFEIADAQRAERHRVRPLFVSTRYGTPAYCQLAASCAEEIVRGADDESEMGVFHDLFQPQRMTALR